MLWGGRWEGGSCLGTHVRIKDFKIKKKKNLEKANCNEGNQIRGHLGIRADERINCNGPRRNFGGQCLFYVLIWVVVT